MSTIQIRRGTRANLNAITLSLGELAFTTDTEELFIGTPGVGPGYVQIGDVGQMNATLSSIYDELKALRRAFVDKLCEDPAFDPDDYDPNIADEETTEEDEE